MLNNENPYNLRTETAGGITNYFVSFADGQGIRRETEVFRPVYLEFLRFAKIERSLRHWDERHREYSEMTDGTLHGKAVNPQRSLEDAVLDSHRNGQLWLAVQSLPEIQRRRFILRHECGMTYGQIAAAEGCHFTSVRIAVVRAEKIIKEKIKIWETQS